VTRLFALLALVGCGGDGASPVTAPVTHEPDLAAMVLIEAGTFSMGHPAEAPGAYGQPWKENELFAHDVALPPFRIDRDEVTVEAYAQFLDEAGGLVHWHPLMPIDRVPGGFAPRSGLERRPIALVSWYDAATFCAWTQERLPTEAEWERAARPDGRTWPWGDEAPDCTRAVYFTGASLCEDAPRDVGASSPGGDSAEGLHDLAGNVAEWVGDFYDRYPDGPEQDPTGPAQGRYRVVRGGGFHDSPSAIRGSARWPADPADRSVGVGFRCALRP
jgi:formylglycine-generating enzyme required for sulfatase activity